MILDHIGVVVPHLEPALRQWEALFGYRQDSDIVVNSRQKVRVVFLRKEGSLTVKLIEPSAPDSPVFQPSRRGAAATCVPLPFGGRSDPIAPGRGPCCWCRRSLGKRLTIIPSPSCWLGISISSLIDTSVKKGQGATDLVDPGTEVSNRPCSSTSHVSSPGEVWFDEEPDGGTAWTGFIIASGPVRWRVVGRSLFLYLAD